MSKFEEFKETLDKAKEELFAPLYEVVEGLEDDAVKYYDNGVKSAGNRVKKGMQDIRKIIKPADARRTFADIQNVAKEARQEIIDSFKK